MERNGKRFEWIMPPEKERSMVRRRITAFRPRHARLRDGSAGANPAGFTLIELLVVLAIISLLLALLWPSLQGARRRAKATVCLSHLKEWGTAFTLYVQDSDGRLPAETPKGIWLLGGVTPEKWPKWMRRYRDY